MTLGSPSDRHAAHAALSSVHTANLPALFAQLGISLVVSTYQAGKLILVRADGDALNTHFRPFVKPMGIAVDRSRMSVGGANAVWHYRNVPAVAAKLDPPGKHDAAWLPGRVHVTGDIDIHEMSWAADGELWAVNTRFGCLCTLDAEYSFTPRWQPAFLSALAPEDRCHLNGLAMVDGRARYVTALGETDTAGGWRSNKARGGILIDVASDKILLRGLSMPHSPRMYRDKLWVLESGEGTLAQADLETRTWRTVAQMPGFTRGIDFHGPLAFIGLSQVRESAVFSGIPLVARLRERTCGVWVVNIETGETLGFIRFESGVQEIFSVAVLPGIRYPELLAFEDPQLGHSYVLPDEALARVHLRSEAELRASPDYHADRAIAFYRGKRLPEAIAAFRECLRLDPRFPGAAYNLGVCLGDAGAYDDAIPQLLRAAEAEPERAEIYNSLGYVHACSARHADALRWYERAIEAQPEYAQAHFNLGMTALLLADYPRGWREYAWRWKTGQFTPFSSPLPRWDGRNIHGQTLMLHTEQGAGDAIQFARYLPMVAARCKRIVLVCPAHLMQLFSTLDGVAELRPPGSFRVTEFDTWLPLMDLPQVLATTFDTIPAEVPYFDLGTLRRRHGDQPRVPPAAPQRRRVGLVWAGSPTHDNDAQRSCRLPDLLPLLRTPGIDFYSLQVGERSQDIAALPSEVTLTDLSPGLADYTDTALVLDELDLLISVDTSVAHLAGALNRPVWILLPQVPDWRWGLAGDTTPWYPSARLFRQTVRSDWHHVVAAVAAALAAAGTA
ncbi:MAG: TIGR03032 family protein [Gammaproteobacteria bacterium]|nr:TIGR03032 family protein [Gammaproteobacteria bacterium]